MPRGGRRPGAGAPKGNLNGLRHGRNSDQVKRLVDALVRIPEARDILLAQRRSELRQQKRARRTAAALLARILTGKPASPQTLDLLQDNRKMFAALIRHLISEAEHFKKSNQTPYLPPEDNQNGDDGQNVA
jgi:hypothetical protein